MTTPGEVRELVAVSSTGQLAALEARATDTRPPLTTPFPSLNALLHRGGLHPGELVVLGGRKGTRKTAVALNWVMHLLQQSVPVGFVSLDESLAMYTVKLMSILARKNPEFLEENWEHPVVHTHREAYSTLADGLVMTDGVRPSVPQLQSWLNWAEMECTGRPRVVFVDYTSLLVHYRSKETERVPRLFEELQVWTRDNDLVTVALHQAGRTDEGTSKKYHGDTPMTAEGLLYGGEQQADVILSTYRPALNMLGNMSRHIAEMVLGDNFDEEKWADAVAMVRRYKRSTMLQLLKNRPSTKGEWFEGAELWSPDDSQYLEEKGEGVSDAGDWEE
jgi:replicative DNA helicase